jgi:hypothetical protein
MTTDLYLFVNAPKEATDIVLRPSAPAETGTATPITFGTFEIIGAHLTRSRARVRLRVGLWAACGSSRAATITTPAPAIRNICSTSTRIPIARVAARHTGSAGHVTGVRFGQRGHATEPDEELLVLGVSAFMLIGGNR